MYQLTTFPQFSYMRVHARDKTEDESQTYIHKTSIIRQILGVEVCDIYVRHILLQYVFYIVLSNVFSFFKEKNVFLRIYSKELS